MEVQNIKGKWRIVGSVCALSCSRSCALAGVDALFSHMVLFGLGFWYGISLGIFAMPVIYLQKCRNPSNMIQTNRNTWTKREREKCRRSTKLCEANDGAPAYVLVCTQFQDFCVCPIVEVAFFVGLAFYHLVFWLRFFFGCRISWIRLKMLIRFGIMCTPFDALHSFFLGFCRFDFLIISKSWFFLLGGGLVLFIFHPLWSNLLFLIVELIGEKSTQIRILIVRCNKWNKKKTWIEQLLDRQFNEYSNEDHRFSELCCSNGTQWADNENNERWTLSIHNFARDSFGRTPICWDIGSSVDFIKMQPLFYVFSWQSSLATCCYYLPIFEYSAPAELRFFFLHLKSLSSSIHCKSRFEF